METLTENIKGYWANRSKGYSKVNKDELACDQKKKWLAAIEKRLGVQDKKNYKILDIGTGPGFFSIILAEAGYEVTAVDFTQDMLDEAKLNAGILAGEIKFYAMDAHKLEFSDNYFDCIVSRNLTWNLENPGRAYSEWMRVLKQDGIILNFDANWYCYIEDDEKRKQYEEDRKRAQNKQVEDFYEGTDIEKMEDIAKKLPLSSTARPVWDERVLSNHGAAEIIVDTEIWQEVWSAEEKINYTTTPMFLVMARK